MIEEKSATELFTLLPCTLSLARCSGGVGSEGDRESGIPVGYHQAFAATIAVSWGVPGRQRTWWLRKKHMNLPQQV